MKDKIRLDLLNWQEVKELVPTEIDTIILPIGTLEAHGTTGVGTDSIIAERGAEMMAKKLGCLVAPAINYGITNTLLQYPGSQSMSREVFMDYVWEVLSGLARMGFQKIIIMNGHGGQEDELKQITTEFANASDTWLILYHWWYNIERAIAEAYGRDIKLEAGHSGNEETAMMIALCPEGVQEHLYSKDNEYIVDSGLKAVPSPGTILNFPDSGDFDFDSKKAEKFAEIVIDELVEKAKDIFERWERAFS